MEMQGGVASALGAALRAKIDQWKQRTGWQSKLEPPLGRSYSMRRWGGVCTIIQ